MLNSLYLIFIYISTAIALPTFFCCLEVLSFIVQNQSLDLWKTNCWVIIKILLGTKQITLPGSNKIEKGFILCNHRSIFDIPYDPYMMDAFTVGRTGACLFGNMASVLGIFSNRGLWFNRGSTSRHKLMDMIINRLNSPNTKLKRVVFYPEGTRKKYRILWGKDDVKNIIKKGLIKSIYEHKKIPVQNYISANKEYPMSLMPFRAKPGITIISKLGDPIYPDDFDTFDSFLDYICNDWFELWYETHRHPKAIQRNSIVF
tara:strand:+ start:800 stop:1576 length:777 start_codon:yes stop_codon:yes gene_type:complete